MRLAPIASFMAFAVAAFAEPTVVRVKCPACSGRRSLSLTPPNLGQYDGEIGVTPGKPFTTRRWDVKYDRCPLCDGKGWREKYKTRVPRPTAEELADMDVCPDCRLSGVTPCRKCVATGFLACQSCRSAAAAGGKPGWTKTERRTKGATSRHVKIAVVPCATCLGVGKVVCAACMGMGAVQCRKCSGNGTLPKKERR